MSCIDRDCAECHVPDTTVAEDVAAALASPYRDECHGIVTRDGEQQPCEKPTTCLIDDPEGMWAACTYHAHRYGYGRVVPLSVMLAARTRP